MPVEVIAQHQLLEKRLKVKVTKQQLGGGAALTEAMIAGATDIGFMGLGPFFVGWAKGIDWKIAASMQDMPIGLNAIKPGAKSLKDIGPTDKIAVPGINSIQHVMLAMEAQKQLGDARALDKAVVTAKFKNERPEVYKAFAEAMAEAVAWRENPDKIHCEAAEGLARSDVGEPARQTGQLISRKSCACNGCVIQL